MNLIPCVTPPPPPLAISAQSAPASAIGVRLTQLLVEAQTYSRDNASDWRSLTSALIEAIAGECEASNWDGYGAAAIRAGVKEQAQRFINLLPFRLPPPDPTVDPDGDIALVWDFGPGHVRSVSVGADGVLTYAGLLGDGVKRHGVERFEADIPKVILQSIEELVEKSKSASRLAGR